MSIDQEEKGFVLATSLVMLLLMTLLTVAVYVSVDSSQKSSMAAESATEAFYYAETAANYMAWALYNNAEFDSYTYPDPVRTDLSGAANHRFGEPNDRAEHELFPNNIPDHTVTGDLAEWLENPGNPSGDNLVDNYSSTGSADLYVQDTYGNFVYGQLMYYDNSPWSGRMVFLKSSDMYSEGSSGLPDLFEIHKKLPRYIVLSIDSYGNITPSMPPYSTTAPHHGNVMGVDYPENGAIVWLTGGNRTDDHVIDPIDHYFARIRTLSGIYDPYSVYGDVDGNVPDYHETGVTVNKNIACKLADSGEDTIACSHDGAWLKGQDYGLVIYALGYVRGKAHKLVRVVYK